MTCITSLVRILPRVQKISLLLEKLCNFFTFSNYYFLPQKTTASQTHFGFTNIGSNMHHFCATTIWNTKISNETPCSLKTTQLECIFQRRFTKSHFPEGFKCSLFVCTIKLGIKLDCKSTTASQRSQNCLLKAANAIVASYQRIS